MLNAKEAWEKALESRKIAQAEQESIFQDCLSIVNQCIECAINQGDTLCIVNKKNFSVAPKQNFYDFLRNLGYTVLMCCDHFEVSWEKDK
jgi:hypothetical protein